MNKRVEIGWDEITIEELFSLGASEVQLYVDGDAHTVVIEEMKE